MTSQHDHEAWLASDAPAPGQPATADDVIKFAEIRRDDALLLAQTVAELARTGDVAMTPRLALDLAHFQQSSARYEQARTAMLANLPHRIPDIDPAA